VDLRAGLDDVRFKENLLSLPGVESWPFNPWLHRLNWGGGGFPPLHNTSSWHSVQLTKQRKHSLRLWEELEAGRSYVMKPDTSTQHDSWLSKKATLPSP
jgi:hypothetical protein